MPDLRIADDFVKALEGSRHFLRVCLRDAPTDPFYGKGSYLADLDPGALR
jgi:hypothetical protein